MTTAPTITTQHPGVPRPVAIFTWILIFAGCFFFSVYTFRPDISFPNANLDSYSAQLGFGSTGVRILGSVLALLMSVWANDARWLSSRWCRASLSSWVMSSSACCSMDRRPIQERCWCWPPWRSGRPSPCGERSTPGDPQCPDDLPTNIDGGGAPSSE